MMLKKIVDGRTDLILPYTDSGGSPKSTHDGASLIRWAAYYGDVSAVRYLEGLGVPLSDLGANLDLNGAAFHGHWQLCQYLLENGSDADFRSPIDGSSALHATLSHCNRPVSLLISRLLLHHGADPNCATIPGVDSGNFMRDVRTCGETPLHYAAAYGNAEVIQLLLDAGADKEAEDVHGETPLSWASRHQRPGAILDLLKYGSHGIHPLHIQNMQSDHGAGWGAGMSIMRLGSPHFDE